uniref:Uncharacterized protein n=1 Tax=Rhizophora mucronata TaxID=61149 RepID=A0A2P2NRZ6_RHIMU
MPQHPITAKETGCGAKL